MLGIYVRFQIFEIKNGKKDVQNAMDLTQRKMGKRMADRAINAMIATTVLQITEELFLKNMKVYFVIILMENRPFFSFLRNIV